ncbi:unnamed protein product [Lactuca virosa]|uniref:Uncharacterized protein n=1 Tax=Lactuca virosa TaxID=75947 RepID=A0AAU9LVG8_9ASTR|nr:unnamed protein product [Lactuca virosa]
MRKSCVSVMCRYHAGSFPFVEEVPETKMKTVSDMIQQKGQSKRSAKPVAFVMWGLLPPFYCLICFQLHCPFLNVTLLIIFSTPSTPICQVTPTVDYKWLLLSYALSIPDSKLMRASDYSPQPSDDCSPIFLLASPPCVPTACFIRQYRYRFFSFI